MPEQLQPAVQAEDVCHAAGPHAGFRAGPSKAGNGLPQLYLERRKPVRFLHGGVGKPAIAGPNLCSFLQIPRFRKCESYEVSGRRRLPSLPRKHRDEALPPAADRVQAGGARDFSVDHPGRGSRETRADQGARLGECTARAAVRAPPEREEHAPPG